MPRFAESYICPKTNEPCPFPEFCFGVSFMAVNQQAVQDAVDEVNAHCGPDKMPDKQEAIVFLQDVIDKLNDAIEALSIEIDNAKDE